MEKKIPADLLIENASEIATPKDEGLPRGGDGQGELNLLRDASLASFKGIIVAIGEAKRVKTSIELTQDAICIDARGKAVIPGFVDPHTHLVYMGDRHEEFVLRLRGATYTEILKRGGGILDTVRRTRAASEEELLLEAKKRVRILISEGTTTVEIKSGYGLTTDSEVKILKVARRLSEETPVDVVTTFLGAHAFPPEIKREKYIKIILDEMLDAAIPYSEFCDVFLDVGAFTFDEAKIILEKAKEKGYKLKIHADELSPSGGAELAGQLGATSADHLVYPSGEGLNKLKEGGTIAVLLPGTSLLLGGKYAPYKKFVEKGIPVALATDHNPGTSPIYSQAVIMGLAVFNMGMKPEEALTACTLNAAYAIGRGREVGSLDVGKRTDLLILKSHSYIHLIYEFGRNLIDKVIKGGKIVYSS
jgi:imidazolonepropionase